MKPTLLYKTASALVGRILLSSSTLAFAPPSAPTRTMPARGASETEEGTSVVDAGGSWSIGVPSRDMVEAAKKKQVAKDALNKLLERQQRDVKQTLELLENIDGIDIDHEASHEGDGHESHAEGSLPFIAASIASGTDYGFVSRSEGCRTESIDLEYLGEDARFDGYGPPGNVFALGSQQFMRNLRAMIGEYKDEEDGPALTGRQRDLQSRLAGLTLSSDAIWEREEARGPIEAPWIIKVPYFVLCYFLDVVFEGSNCFSRFFLLETVARMPYFSYITMLHLYETLGFWRRSADIKRIHFAEEWNEFHHLMIMESLGGDQPYWVRFMAQHSALSYYVALCILWMISPSLSYKFSQMLETHAVDTYGQFIDENEDALKDLPPSIVALEYYTVGLSDPMFGEYQTASVGDGGEVRRPGKDLRTLHDVFLAIRADEGDHVHTMTSCLDPAVPTLSPGLESRVLTGVALAAGTGLLLGGGGIDGLSGVGDGLFGIEGMASLSDMVGGMKDLDSIVTEDGGGASNLIDAIVAGAADLSNGLNGLAGTEGVDVDDDIAGSAVEDLAAGGMDGFEVETLLELIKSIGMGILELIPFI